MSVGASVQPVGLEGASCDEIVYPVPAQYVGTDDHNWHETGAYWSKWHTGTDFSAPCGTIVYAAHADTIEIDTTQCSWAGPQLVKVTTGSGGGVDYLVRPHADRHREPRRDGRRR